MCSRLICTYIVPGVIVRTLPEELVRTNLDLNLYVQYSGKFCTYI